MEEYQYCLIRKDGRKYLRDLNNDSEQFPVEREHILYKNFVQVGEVKEMINEVLKFKVK